MNGKELENKYSTGHSLSPSKGSSTGINHFSESQLEDKENPAKTLSHQEIDQDHLNSKRNDNKDHDNPLIMNEKAHSGDQKSKDLNRMNYPSEISQNQHPSTKSQSDAIVFNEKAQSNNVKLNDSRRNLDSVYFRQTSESPSPISHQKEKLNLKSNTGIPTTDEQYMSNQFFIDDTLKNDQNNYSENNIDYFHLTPDQELALRELKLRQQQREFEEDDDFELNYDYDVREKLETLNAQLANEPSPPEPEHRNSKVAFKDELISLVAPPYEYTQSESEQEEFSEGFISEPVPNIIARGSNDSSPSDHPRKIDSPPSPQETTNNESSPEKVSLEPEKDLKIDEAETEQQTIHENDNHSDNNIVVSRGGNFLLMDQNDMFVASTNFDHNDEANVVNNNEKNKQRPVSAPATKPTRNENWQHFQIDSSNSSTKSEMNYPTAPNERSNTKIMDVPRVDRQLLQRQKEREENKRKEQKEREEQEAKEKKELNDKCFNAWLQSKNRTMKEDSDRKKKEEEEERRQKEKTQEERRIKAQENEKELTKNWEQYKRREEKLRQYRIKEMEESMIVHTKVECRKAFKEWVKKKKQGYLAKQNEEKQKARVTRLAMRQCRKSQNLAQAIHQANSFRYLDFYGYP